jgi:very-short-patch-repair endonuclease
MTQSARQRNRLPTTTGRCAQWGMHWEPILIEWANTHHHLLRRTDALRLGVPTETWRRMERSVRWVQVAPDILRHSATALTFEMQVRAGGDWLGAKGALFGTTALRWLGVEVDEPRSAEFLVPRSVRWVPNWMTIHTTTRWNDSDVIRRQGVRTTMADRAILDMAYSERRAHAIEQAIDSAVRIRATAMPRLHRRLAALSGRGRHGCSLVRELLLDSGGESFLERRFLRLVRLPRPRCQVVMRGDGPRVARVDFVFGDRLVVEVSGRLGHASDRDRQRDARRRNELARQGHTVIEFTTADVIDDPAHVISTLTSWLPVMPTTRHRPR